MSKSHVHRNSLSLAQGKKPKLIATCKKYGLSTAGSKIEMAERISKYESTSMQKKARTGPAKPKNRKAQSVDDAATDHAAILLHKSTDSAPLLSLLPSTATVSNEEPQNITPLVTLPDGEGPIEHESASESEEIPQPSLDNSAILERSVAVKEERRNRQQQLTMDFEQLSDNGLVCVLVSSSADEEQEPSPKSVVPDHDEHNALQRQVNERIHISPPVVNDEGKNEDLDSSNGVHVIAAENDVSDHKSEVSESGPGSKESDVNHSQEKPNVLSNYASDQNQKMQSDINIPEGPSQKVLSRTDQLQKLFAQIAVCSQHDPHLKKVLSPIQEMNEKLAQMVDDEQMPKENEVLGQILGFVQELNRKTVDLLSEVVKNNDQEHDMNGSVPDEEKEESPEKSQKKRLSMQLKEIGEVETVATTIGSKYGDQYATEWNNTIVTHVQSQQQSLKNSALKPVAVDYVHSLLENDGNNEGFDRLLRMISHGEEKHKTKQ